MCIIKTNSLDCVSLPAENKQMEWVSEHSLAISFPE